MKLLVFLHRWLGTVTCLFFLLWFASGIVMMYAEMPELTREEHLATLPPLDAVRARLSAAEAIERAQLDYFSDISLTSLFGRPVWSIRTEGTWYTVFADTGEVKNAFSYEETQPSIQPFLSAGAHPRLVAALVEPDQWTVGGNYQGLRPLYRVALDDPAKTELYIAAATGQVVLRSTARTRMLAWAGAIPHWIYLTGIRKHGAFWSQLVIWLSATGCLVALLGLAVGVWRSSPSRRYFVRHYNRRTWSPFVGMMRWHHWAGLIFGTLTFTWVFSGMLSMDPSFYPSSGSNPTPEQVEAFSGPTLDYDAFNSPPARLIGLYPSAKEIQLSQVGGQPYYLMVSDQQRQELIDGAGRPVSGFPDGFLVAAAKRAVPNANIVEQVVLNKYDAYYYDRLRQKPPLPVLRLKFDDPARTWLYVDPRRGEIVSRYERSGRVERWLYHGLHSWDFPFLWSFRPAWDIVVIALCLGGVFLSITGVVMGYRALKSATLR